MQVYIDGKYYNKADAKISVFDHGLLYGDGIFEGIRVYNDRVFKLDAHLERLKRSADAVFIDLPIPLVEIKKAVIETVNRNQLKDAYIRLIVTRGPGDLGLDLRKCREGSSLIIIVDLITLYPQTAYDNGLFIVTSSVVQKRTDQLPPSVKSLNYLANILAHAESVRQGAQEALLLNIEGYVTECSADNIFFVKSGKIYTSPSSVGILEGITRGVVMELACEKLASPVIEKLFKPQELYEADEIFLTGTGAEVIGVVKVDHNVIGLGVPGPTTRLLTQLFREYANAT